MATEDNRNLDDYAAGFSDERAAAPGDDEAFTGPADDGDTGGMNLDAAAATDGVKTPEAAGTDAAAEGSEAAAGGNASAASTGGNPDNKPIERQPEGGGESAASASADNGAGGNESGDASGSPDVAIVIGAVSPTDSPVGDVDPANPAPGPDDEPTDPADLQRKRSWEGRLNAREAELKKIADELEAKGKGAGQAPGEATGEALEAVASQAEGTNPTMADEAGQLAGQVERGEISPEDAMAQLKEDFGEPFVNMIQAIATSAAGKALDGLRGDIDKLRGDNEDVIAHLKNGAEKAHFTEIAKEFPDFNEIGKSPEFAAFIDALPTEEKAKAEETKADGSAADIIALLKKFEASKGGQGDGAATGGEQVAAAPAAAAIPPTAGPSEEELDAAGGVRGGGMQLPTEPSGDDDFAGAWNDTPDVKGRG